MGQGHEDKRVRRARAQIDKALARQDVDLAVEAVMALEKAARPPFFTQASPFFRRKLADLHRTGTWARLHTLAARAEQEPRLLTHEADDAQQAVARWPLFLACMRARDFGRAGRYWQSLHDGVAARAPGLARALRAWVQGQGQIDSSCLADLDLDRLPGSVALDSSGPSHARPRSRPAVPAAPASVEQVEDALHTLFAAQPLPVASDTLRVWLDGASPALAKTLRSQAGSLATRELLIAASAGTSLAEAGQALARMAAGAADDVAEGLLLATRLFLETAATKQLRLVEAAALDALVAALVTTTQMESVADVLAIDLAGQPGLASAALRICQGILTRAETLPDPRLFAIWLLALDLNGPADDVDQEDLHNVPGPTWLQAATRAVCGRATALAACLDQLDPKVRDDRLDDLVWGQPVDLVADLIDAVWTVASEDTRRSLASIIPALITTAEDLSLDRMASSRSLGHMAIFDRIAAAADTADPDLPFFGAGGLVMWNRLGLRALPYHEWLLPFALSQAHNVGQHVEVVKTYVAGKADIHAYLEVMRELGQGDSRILPPLVDETCRLMIERFRNDRVALARGLIDAATLGAPWLYQKKLAHAYQRAVLVGDDAAVTPDDRRAVKIMASILGEQDRSPRKSQTGKGRKANQRRKPKQSKEQLPLPLDEEEP